MFTCLDNTFLKSSLSDNIIKFEVIKASPNDLEWISSKTIVDNWYDYIESANIQVGMIFLLGNLIYIKPTFLLEWKEIFNSKREKTRKYIIGTAIVVENAIIRTFVNTFFTNFNSERPVKFVKDEYSGKEFINSIK